MSARGLIPLIFGGGLAWWAYKKNEGEGKEVEQDEDEDDLHPLESLSREISAQREEAAREAKAKLATREVVEEEVVVSSDEMDSGS